LTKGGIYDIIIYMKKIIFLTATKGKEQRVILLGDDAEVYELIVKNGEWELMFEFGYH